MEQLRPLLEYLQSVNPSAEFTLSGNIPAKRTELEYLNTLGKITTVDFNVSFKNVLDPLLIDSEWLETTGVIFHTLRWSGIIEKERSNITVYLNKSNQSMYVKSNTPLFTRNLEEISYRLDLKFFTDSRGNSF